MTESTDYPYNKVNILPKVEGFRAVPRDPESKAHILYQTTSQAYGQVALEVKFCFLTFYHRSKRQNSSCQCSVTHSDRL